MRREFKCPALTSFGFLSPSQYVTIFCPMCFQALASSLARSFWPEMKSNGFDAVTEVGFLSIVPPRAHSEHSVQYRAAYFTKIQQFRTSRIIYVYIYIRLHIHTCIYIYIPIDPFLDVRNKGGKNWF